MEQRENDYMRELRAEIADVEADLERCREMESRFMASGNGELWRSVNRDRRKLEDELAHLKTELMMERIREGKRARRDSRKEQGHP